jgi:hypothetical protein
MPDKSKKGGEERYKEQPMNLSGHLFEHATHHVAALRLHPWPSTGPHTNAHKQQHLLISRYCRELTIVLTLQTFLKIILFVFIRQFGLRICLE